MNPQTRTQNSALVVSPEMQSCVLFDQLGTILQALVEEHRRMLELAGEHRHAIAQADIRAMSACLEQEQTHARRVSDLERERLGVVARLASMNPAQHRTLKPTIRLLVERAEPLVRERLTAISATLREILLSLHKEHQALKSAALTLSTHMEGIMRQVCRHLAHAGTYAPTGALDSRVQVMSALDIRS